MSDYLQFIATVLRLIQDRGLAVTITYRTGGSYSPSTGTVTVSTSTATAYGIFSSQERELFDANGELRTRYDKKMLIAASGLTEPKKNDTVTIGSQAYEIVAVTTVAPAGTAILYKVWLKV